MEDADVKSLGRSKWGIISRKLRPILIFMFTEALIAKAGTTSKPGSKQSTPKGRTGVTAKIVKDKVPPAKKKGQIQQKG